MSFNSLYHVYIKEFWQNINEFIAACHTYCLVCAEICLEDVK